MKKRVNDFRISLSRCRSGHCILFFLIFFFMLCVDSFPSSVILQKPWIIFTAISNETMLISTSAAYNHLKTWKTCRWCLNVYAVNHPPRETDDLNITFLLKETVEQLQASRWGARVSLEPQERALIRGQLDRPEALTEECDKHAKTQPRVCPSWLPANVSSSDKHKSIRALSLSDNEDRHAGGGRGAAEDKLFLFLHYVNMNIKARGVNVSKSEILYLY